MGTTRRLAALGLAAALVAGCSGDDDPGSATVAGADTAEASPTAADDAETADPEPAPSPTASASTPEDEPTVDEPTAEPTEEESTPPPARAVIDLATVAAQDQPEDGWVLDGGTYTHDAFDEVAFDIPAGTTVRFFEDDGLVALTRPEFTASDDIVWFVPADGIVPPDRAGVHIPHDEDPRAFAVPVPVGLETWFAAVPQTEVLAGGSGDSAAGAYAWWDVVLRPELGETFDDCGHQACIHNVVLESGAAIHADVWTVRYSQLASVPHLLVWSQEREGMGPAAALVEQLVASASPVP